MTSLEVRIGHLQFRLCIRDQVPFQVIMARGIARPATQAEVEQLMSAFREWMKEYDDLVEAGKFR